MRVPVCRLYLGRKHGLRLLLQKRSTWRWPQELARRFPCGVTGGLRFRDAMLGVPR